MGLLALWSWAAVWVYPSLAAPDACDGFGPVTESQPAVAGDTVVRGDQRNDMLGHGLAAVGDLNADGHVDLAIGVPGDDTNGPSAGAVYVFFGPIGARGALTGAQADVRLYGDVYLRAGWTVAGAGDLDQDGYDDLAIGSLPTSRASDPSGRVWLVSGGPSLAGELDLQTQSHAVLTGAGASEFGSVLGAAGDMDGDGFDELLVGAPLAGGGLGAVYAFHGPLAGPVGASAATVTYQGQVASGRLGEAVTGAGDLDGDGLADIALGAPRSSTAGPLAGAAYLVYGDPARAGVVSVGAAAGAELLGGAYDTLGASMSPAGDVDGDGLDDLWLGAKQYASSKRGAVFLVRGGAASLGVAWADQVSEATIVGRDAADLFGSAVVGAVDFNADGVPDVLVGAERGDGAVLQTGAAWALLGPFSGEQVVSYASGAYPGPHYLSSAGATVAAWPDPYGDGFADFAIGAWRGDVGGVRGAGFVSVFLGGEDVTDELPWYADSDGDTWGDDASVLNACAAPPGYVASPGDCDDADADVHPYALELDCADPVDRNCDGSVGAVDRDGDGARACEGDCDDTSAAVQPAAEERCGDRIDNDCDGATDDATAVDARTWYPDSDGDGFGNRAIGFTRCVAPSFFLTPPVQIGGDCNDLDPSVSPAQPERCDGIDNDCDDSEDEDDALDAAQWFADADGDGFGDRLTRAWSCLQPPGYVADLSDCDDASAAVLPGAAEVCDGLDNDCDGVNYLGGPVSLARGWLWLTGGSPGEAAGTQLSVAADMDGDGYDELVVGAPRHSEQVSHGGAVYLRDGDPLGGSYDLAEVRADGSVRWDARIRSNARAAALGSALAVGDFNGDGVEDLAIGAPGTASGGLGRGAVLVYYGPVRGDLDELDAAVVLRGAAAGDAAGTCLGAGDLDGDGVDELLVGAPGASQSAAGQGVVYVVYGGGWASAGLDVAGAAVLRGAAGDHLGMACAVVGDLDGDGAPELAAGAPLAEQDRGRVLVWTGVAGRYAGVVAPSAEMRGVRLTDRLGASIARSGDVDGDGYADLLIGSGANAAYLYFGNPGALPSGDPNTGADVALHGATGDQAGLQVAHVGDVNGDGLGDVLISARGDDTVAGGAAVLLYGGVAWSSDVLLGEVESLGRGDGGVTYDHRDLGSAHGARLLGAGAAVAGGGDLNGDGLPDLALGAPDSGAGEVVTVSAGAYGLDVASTTPFEASKTLHYVDSDADGQADEAAIELLECPFHVAVDHLGPRAPAPRAVTDLALATDCDDADPARFLGAPERDRDGVDSDCDGFDSANQLPGLIVRLSPDDPHTDTVLSAIVDVFDPEAGTMDETPITLHYGWRVNGVSLGVETPTLDGALWFARDDVVHVDVWADDTRGSTDTVSWSTTILNGRPSLSNLVITPGAPRMNDVVAVSWQHADPDVADPLTVDCEWSVQWIDPLGIERWNDLDGQHTEVMGRCDAIRNCTYGRAMRARCRPWDGRVWGDWAVSPEFMILPGSNTPPVAQGCNISPATPSRRADITVAPTATDLEGDAVTWSFAWSVNGVPDPSVTTSTYPRANFQRGDVVEVVCTPSDGGGAGTSVSEDVTVVNAPPEPPEVAVLPDPADVDDDLWCALIVPSTDADGDALTYTIAWTLDGVPWAGPTSTTSVAGDTILAADVVLGDWTCTVTPDDGTDAGDPASDTRTVDPIPNDPPVASACTLSPLAPSTAGDLTATPSGVDPDGDPITWSYTWSVNGGVDPSATGPTYPASDFQRDDVVLVVCTPSDPFAPGTPASDVVTIGNAPPDAPTVDLTPDPADADDDLVCVLTSAATDPDGDALSYVITWSVDGAPYLGPTDSTSLPGDTVAAAQVVAGDWTCEITADDGFDAGPPGSDTQTVDPGAPARPGHTMVAGDDANCVLTTDGEVVCWGEGTAGKLGRGSIEDIGDEPREMEDHLVPVDLGTIGTPVAVELGQDFGCAVFDDGRLKCWGKNASGQLGLGHASDLGNSAGELGDALPFVDLGAGAAVAQVSAHYTHACAILSTGALKCWGSGARGQLGNGDWSAVGDEPGEMGDALAPVDLGTGRAAVKVATGTDFTCALLDDGSVKCWGLNNNGQLGQGHTTELGDDPGEMGDLLPAVDLGSVGAVVDLQAGETTVCALFDHGGLKCWGGNTHGQAGQGTSSDVGDGPGEMGDALPFIDLGAGRSAVSVGVGLQFTCALLDDASVKCFGRGHLGQLGSGGTASLGNDPGEMGDALPPLALSSHLDVHSLAVGYTHACVVMTCGQLKCWGGNVKGELGQADFAPRGDGPNEMGDLLPVVPLGARTIEALPAPPATCPYSHSLTVDGDDSDWLAAEVFATSSGGSTATMISWDDTFVYLGVRHPDVGAADNDHHVMAYFGNGEGAAGAFPALRAGRRITPQQPALSFWSQAAVQWRSDNSADYYSYAATSFGSTTWQDQSFYFSIWETNDALVASNGVDVLELRLHREALRLSTTTMLVHVSWLDDTSGAENSYAATPDGSFVEGAVDPDHGLMWEFDLSSVAGPAGAVVEVAVP